MATCKKHVNIRAVKGGESTLIAAAREGHRQCIEYLLAAGADLNETNSSGETAMMKAAETRNSRCLQLLVQAGADVNAQDVYGFTALLKATWAHNMECMRILVKAGANVNYLSDDCRGKAMTGSDVRSRNRSSCMCEIPDRSRSRCEQDHTSKLWWDFCVDICSKKWEL